MMISSVPKHLRALGNSTSQLAQNLIGFFPSPFLYGLVCRLTGGEESRWGMALLMFWSLWGIVGVSVAKFYYKCDAGHITGEIPRDLIKSEIEGKTLENEPISILTEDEKVLPLEEKSNEQEANQPETYRNNKIRSLSHNIGALDDGLNFANHQARPPRRTIGSTPKKFLMGQSQDLDQPLMDDFNMKWASPTIRKKTTRFRRKISRQASLNIQNISLITSMNSIPLNDSDSSDSSQE
jgi:hypothetical protein